MYSRVLLAAAMLLAASAHAQPLTLKFSHFLGPTSFFQHDVDEPFAKELETRSGGRAKVSMRHFHTAAGRI